jgi:1-acyl-sn-glycerol-3-phosphate acyltransferase
MSIQHRSRRAEFLFNNLYHIRQHTSRIWYGLGRLLVWVFVHLVYRLNIQRHVAIPRGAKIMASNHPGTFDPALMTLLVPEQVSILVNEFLFKVPLFGASMTLSGHIPVNFSNGKPALEEGVRRLQAGGTIGIFPEGDISEEKGYRRPHTGVARLALRTGAPVIPIGVYLDPQHLLRVQTKAKDGETSVGAWYFQGPYAITVGAPMIFKGDPEDRLLVRQVAEQIMQRIIVLSLEGGERVRRTPFTRSIVRSASTLAFQWVSRSVFLLFSSKPVL